MTQNHSASLLVELLTEELPPKALARLGDAFAEGIAQRLAARDLIEGELAFERYATPRRLAVVVQNVRAVAPERQVREKVLPVSVALDAQGAPSAPLAKKLAALGHPNLSIADLERAHDGKAEAFFVNYAAPGATLADGLQAALDETLAKLPIPKVMTYQRPDGTDVQFVRPVHRLTVLHGDRIVPVAAFGIDAGDTTLGHRFLSDGLVAIRHANAYADTLREKGRVLAHFAQRRETIRTQLEANANGDRVVMPEALLDEVTSLVEWPVVYPCRFEDEFLQVPQECLILTMQTNQKYFALTDAAGKLRSRFLIVSNIETKTPGEIVEGNERVVRPRLADAKFFFEQDKKKPLAERVPLLANVVYHNKLGSQLARVERLETLAGEIAPAIGADATVAIRAARLAKADLLTDMVGEFPELQGTMGHGTTRATTASPKTSRSRAASTTSRASPATRCRRRPCRPRSRSPTSSRRSSASGASALRRRARRTRSRCAGTRSACCACCSKSSCRSISSGCCAPRTSASRRCRASPNRPTRSMRSSSTACAACCASAATRRAKSTRC